MPTPKQIWTFSAAIVDLYHRTGGKLLPLEKVEARFDICKECPHFDGNGCILCGCCSGKKRTLFNKLAYPTQSCPDGRWGEEPPSNLPQQ
jgi:hypothetical protein